MAKAENTPELNVENGRDVSHEVTGAFTPESDPRAFRDALGRFATGVTLITCMTETGPVAFTANSFAAVSLDPPLVLWSPARASARFAIFEAASHYAIHVLSREQRPMLTRFARGGEGFAGLDYSLNADGVPQIAGALARLDCARHAAHDGGDHLIIVGRVLRAVKAEGAPLVFSQGHYGQFHAG